jgi:hypothetical protein
MHGVSESNETLEAKESRRPNLGLFTMERVNSGRRNGSEAR